MFANLGSCAAAPTRDQSVQYLMNVRSADLVQAFAVPPGQNVEPQDPLNVSPRANAWLDFLLDKSLESAVEGIFLPLNMIRDLLLTYSPALAGSEHYLPGALSCRLKVQRRRGTERNPVLLPG
jgi:hypothetical protein